MSGEEYKLTKPSTGPYPEPDESTAYHPSLLKLKTLIFVGTNGMKPLVTEFVA
jgi:hypothetical protein